MSVDAKQEGYPSHWLHATIHLNPQTGEMHSDGDHSVRTWLEERLDTEKRARNQALVNGRWVPATPIPSSFGMRVERAWRAALKAWRS